MSSTGLYIGPVSGNVNGSSITGLIKEFELRELDTWLLPPPKLDSQSCFSLGISSSRETNENSEPVP